MKVDVAGNIELGVAFGQVGLDSRDYKVIGEFVWVVIERFMREFPETPYHD